MKRESRFFLTLTFTFISMFFSAATVSAAQSEVKVKKALLIANSNYENISDLSTPEKEARDLGKVLESLGFDVTIIVDATQSQMDSALDTFSRRSQYNCDIGFFHYGGHAIQINGDNYLVPVDAKMTDERNVKRGSIELDAVMDCMKSETNIVVIDACRDNPFDSNGTRGFSSKRGLSLVKENNRPKNSVVVLSASEGQTATDGVFTPILTRHLTDKKDFILVLRDVRREVYEKTNGRQQPITSEKLISDLYLAGVPSSTATSTVVTTSDINKKIKVDYVAQGKEEYNKRNYSAALENFQMAEKEKQRGCYPYLAAMYEKGNGVDKDLQKSFKYYEMAAKRDDIPSQLKVAEFYTNGTGTKKDLKKAFAWYKEAADLDNISAILTVAKLYEEGTGIQQTPKLAFEYYQKAAEKGDKYGEYHTGRCYYSGIGVKRDINKSKVYLDKAKDQELEEAKIYLGHIEYDLCQPYLKKSNYTEYMEGLKKAADYGYMYAQYDYAMIWHDGKYGKETSYYTAQSYLQMAAAQGYAEAQYMLGRLYYEGHSYWSSKSDALPYWEKAAEQNHIGAYIALGVYYKETNASSSWYSHSYDYVKAAEYLQKAIDLGDKGEANYHLGMIYSKGNDTLPQDYSKAFSCLSQSANAKFSKSYVPLGNCYKEGKGTKTNLSQAFKYYELASKENDATGTFRLGECYFNGWGTKKNLAKAESCMKTIYEDKIEASSDEWVNARDYLGKINLEKADLLYATAKTEDEKKAVFNLIKEAADVYLHSAAYAVLGSCYYAGFGTEQNYSSSAYYFKKATYYEDENTATAAFLYAKQNYLGQGMYQDYSTAFSYFKTAAQGKVTAAYYFLGECYENGRGCTQSYSNAIEWYKKSAEEAASGENKEISMYRLAELYQNTWGYEYTDEELLKLYTKSADMGYGPAQFKLAQAYHTGNFSFAAKDENKSKKYLKMAFDNNNSDAVYVQNNGWDAYLNKNRTYWW